MIEFLVDKTVALICKKWITKDVVNATEVIKLPGSGYRLFSWRKSI